VGQGQVFLEGIQKKRVRDHEKPKDCIEMRQVTIYWVDSVIWKFFSSTSTIGTGKKNLRWKTNYFPFPSLFSKKGAAMKTNCAIGEGFEISPRFRQTIESRIERLEKDASFDEMQIDGLEDADHIRRHLRLVAMQRAEALRMRLFLDRARTRLPRPLISL